MSLKVEAQQHTISKLSAEANARWASVPSRTFVCSGGNRIVYQHSKLPDGAANGTAVLIYGGQADRHVFKFIGSLLPAYDLLVHDRRNTGESDVDYTQIGTADGQSAENIVQAEDLHELLAYLGLEGQHSCLMVGSSSGARLSVLLALRHPQHVKAMVLMNLTAGRHAAMSLGRSYYLQFATACRDGGMSAVMTSEFYSQRIAQNGSNEARLAKMSTEAFIGAMVASAELYMDTQDDVALGLTADQAQTITVPVLCECDYPSDGGIADGMHRPDVASTLANCFSNCGEPVLTYGTLDGIGVHGNPEPSWVARIGEFAAQLAGGK